MALPGSPTDRIHHVHPQLVGGGIKVTAALIAARVAAIGARYAFTFLSAAFVSIASPALAAVVAIGRLAKLAVVAGMIRPLVATFAALRAALIGVAVVGAAGGAQDGPGGDGSWCTASGVRRNHRLSTALGG